MTSEDPRSITAVVHSIVGNLEAIVKAEIRLVKAEGQLVLERLGRAAGVLAVGAALAQLALGFVLLAVAEELATVVAPWLADVIVAIVVAVVATVCLTAGLKRLKEVKPDA